MLYIKSILGKFYSECRYLRSGMTSLLQDIKQKTTERNIVLNLNEEYKTLLNKLKSKIRGARLKVALAVNHEVIGFSIDGKQKSL